MYQHSEKVANLDRIRSIAAYDLFDPALSAELAEICDDSAHRLHMPVAAVQAVLDTATATLASSDPQLTALGGAPNEVSICPQVVITSAPVVIEDLSEDPGHRDNPGVRAGLIRAYAGVPLRLPDGAILGSHCVIGPAPHHFTEQNLTTLSENGTEIVKAIRRHQLSATSH